MTEDQGFTVEFLGNPASYAALFEPVSGSVEIIETHISTIFLVGDRAYKLKKALKLPYVDFSTAAIREDACRKEVALNSETAPELYLGVRRITRSPLGLPEFDGGGALLDAVVEMRRFDQNQLFDRLADQSRLTPELMTQTARIIAFHHRRAPAICSDSGAANIAAVLAINEAGFATSRVFAPQDVAKLGAAFRAALSGHAASLDRRAKAGRVRRCHGDLHLRNICLIDGEPRLFDCIEFNLDIATVDVLYDLAFLLMDLWHRGFCDLANLTMNRYFDERDDEDGFGLLPFFMAIRAAVRAHVIATQSEEPGQDSVPLAAEARSYFELAQRLLNCVEPQMIAIGGLSGSGKTTVADMMAARIGAAPGARVLESDRIRKALHGVVAETRLPVTAYSAEMSAKVYREMARHAAIILAQGGSVIAGAVFDDPANRRLMEEAASGVADAHFDGIWLQAPQETLWRRVHDRPKGPSDATTDVLSGQLTRQSTDAGWEPIDASPPPETVVATILFRHSGRNGVAACVRPPAVPRNPESSAFHKGRYSGHPSF